MPTFSQLAARLNEAVDQYAKAEQARVELQGEIASLQQRAPSFEQVGGEAAALLAEAGRLAEQLVEQRPAPGRHDHREGPAAGRAAAGRGHRRGAAGAGAGWRWPSRSAPEVEAERAAVVEETDQVREFRDGLWTTWVGCMVRSAAAGRTRMQRDQALDAGDAAAKAVPNGKAKQPAEPAKAAEDQ